MAEITRSSERTRIAYFPVNLILKETYCMDGQTGIGMKDKYLMLFFKILLLESSEFKTDCLMTGGQEIVQTD